MSIWSYLGIGGGAKDDPGTAEAVRGIVERLDRLEPERARYVARFAYILGRVAHADLEISDRETQAMERAVHALGGLDDAEAVLVVEIAKAQHHLLGSTESYSVTREFGRTATPEQKRELLECLFAISASDEDVSGTEENEIRRIAKELDLAHPEFIAARSSVRDHIALLRREPPA
jgi:uncharacterized tellurite resistance protein B-like protein